MNELKVMVLVVMGMLLCAVAAFAVTNTTFSKPLNSATVGTLGGNQLLERQNAVDTELRARINGIAAHVNYSSAQ